MSLQQSRGGSRDWIWSVDVEGRYAYSNPAVAEIVGYQPEELVGQSSLELLHPEDRKDVEGQLPELVREKHGWQDLVLRWRHKNGTYRWLESNAVPILDTAGEVIGFRGVDRDITERRREEQALTRTRVRVEKLHQASYELAGCRTEDAIYQLTVKAAEEILDFTLCTLDIIEGDRLVVKATSRELPPGASTESSLDEGLAGKTLRTGKSIVFGSLDEVPEAEPTREDFCSGISAPIGDLGVFQVVSTRPNAFTEEDARALDLLLAHTRDNIKRIRLEGELKGQAIHDVLTGVYNRRFFNAVIEREMARSKRYEHPVAFLMIDVNRFKEVNDQFGHLMGDRVLQAVADVLQQSVRESDTVIRYGGDEFLVILPETNGNAGPAVDRIRAGIAERNVENPLLDFPVTLAIGVDHWHPDDPRSIESVLIEADRRMYEDKQLSRA